MCVCVCVCVCVIFVFHLLFSDNLSSVSYHARVWQVQEGHSEDRIKLLPFCKFALSLYYTALCKGQTER